MKRAGGDRHQPRRPHLPRRDHRPRARHPGGGRLRRRDRDAEGGRARHGRLLGRRHRLRLRRPARDRGHRRAARRAAVLPVKIMMNVGNPQLAFDFAQMPNAGVGLARLEFIINNNIGVHPKAILDYPNIDARPEEGGRERRPRPCVAARLLRRQAGRGHRHHRRRVLAEAGDRAAVRLQEQRVPQADRRLALRARGREPDARLPRRVALRQRGLRRGVRDGMRGAGPRAARHGPRQRRGHGAVRAHARAGRARGRHARRSRAASAPPPAAATACG